MNYQDFMQYGNMDLKRSAKAFDDDDFAISAFFAQQGLEKYFKAYFLRFGLFNNPKELGHYQVPKIINELIKILDNPPFERTYDSIINPLKEFLVGLNSIFIKIESNFQIKILAWKGSLQITLSEDEKKIDQGFATKYQKDFAKAVGGMKQSYEPIMEILETLHLEEIQTNDKKTNVLIDFLKTIQNQGRLLDEPEKLSQSTLSTFFAMEKTLRELGWGSGEAIFSKQATKYISKLNYLWCCFRWCDALVISYPHEEISRYPFEIDNKPVLEIYSDRKEELQKFLDVVKQNCDEIKDFINQRV